jgi:hypothetical protein
MDITLNIDEKVMELDEQNIVETKPIPEEEKKTETKNTKNKVR